MARRVPDSGALHLSDQQFARRHAARPSTTACAATPTRGRNAASAPGKKAGGTWPSAWATKSLPLLGAAPGEISLHQNVTLTQAVISSCFDFRGPRNKVVMTDLEFPSIQYLLSRATAPRRARAARSKFRYSAIRSRKISRRHRRNHSLSSPSRSSCSAVPTSSTPAPSSNAPTGSARSSFSMCSRPPARFRSTSARSAPISRSAAC